MTTRPPHQAADAIIGHENMLFLAGGSHTPLLYARGDKPIRPEAVQTFWRNQRRRRNALQRRQIRHVHLIAPDKHTVCAEVFPEPVVCSPGRHVLAQCPDTTFHETVLFPVEALTRHFRRHCYKVDTHFTPHGTGVLVLALLDALQNPGARDQLRLHLAQAPHRQPGWTGDLGWRFDPPHAEDRLSLPRPPFIRCLSNRLAGGNNGMVDLYLNESPEPTPLDRVMLFGDSYGRDMASQLALVSRQLMYLRTPYLHLDLVDGARPDLVITQNAERYLPSTLCDSGRPVFFLMPFFKEQSHAISPEVAEAFSRFLTSGQRLPQL